MITFAPVVRRARLEALMQALDGATTPGRVRIYAGIRPPPGASPAADNSLLVEILLARPCAHIDDTTLTLSSIPETMVVRSGDPSWARLVDGDGHYVADIDAGADGDLEVAPRPLYAGGTVSLELSLTEPE